MYIGVLLVVVGVIVISKARQYYQKKVICWFVAEAGDSPQVKRPEIQHWWKNFRNPPVGSSKRDMIEIQRQYWEARVKFRSKTIWIVVLGSCLVILGAFLIYLILI